MDAASSYTYDDWDQQLLSILVFQSKIAWWIKLGHFSCCPQKESNPGWIVFSNLKKNNKSSGFLFGDQSGEITNIQYDDLIPAPEIEI